MKSAHAICRSVERRRQGAPAVLLVGLLFVLGTAAAAPYRFLTLNVWSEGTNQTARGEAEGIFIDAHDPDLVALQELTPEF